MAIRPIRLLGDPILRTDCQSIVRPKSAAVRVVADDLQETLHDVKSRQGRGRALAAPQIGAPIRVVYIEVDDPLLLINPEIMDVGTNDFLVWDDCFSIPNLLVRVQRAHGIKVKYQDIAGKSHEIEAVEGLAELLQHEIDHLDGVLMIDQPRGLDPFCIREEWNKQYPESERYGEPVLRECCD